MLHIKLLARPDSRVVQWSGIVKVSGISRAWRIFKVTITDDPSYKDQGRDLARSTLSVSVTHPDVG